MHTRLAGFCSTHPLPRWLNTDSQVALEEGTGILRGSSRHWPWRWRCPQTPRRGCRRFAAVREAGDAALETSSSRSNLRLSMFAPSDSSADEILVSVRMSSSGNIVVRQQSIGVTFPEAAERVAVVVVDVSRLSPRWLLPYLPLAGISEALFTVAARYDELLVDVCQLINREGSS